MGLVEEVGAVGAVFGAGGDTQGDPDRSQAGDGGGGQRGAQALPQALGSGGRLTRRQHAELIGADPQRHIDRADRVAQRARHPDQHPIADRPPQRIIDPPQPIDI